MSATDELLEKLRMLKYDYDSMSTSLEDAIDDIAYELEQAIAVTLGQPAKLTAEQVLSMVGKHQPDYCSDTHVCFDWQAIADELNATLGSGTCRSTTPDDAWCFGCSECGKSFPRDKLHLAHNHGEINYCPNCGARVERREQ